jgi:hypothetical protein
MTTVLREFDTISDTATNSTSPSTDVMQLIPAAHSGLIVPAEVGPTRLRLSEELSFADWQALGKRLNEFERSRLWWLGDWCIYGEDHYGGKYAEIIAATEYDYQTVANAKYVARRFEFSRRRENLSWSHHVEVAPLEPAEADRWLDRAAAEHWSQKTLRLEIGAAATRGLLEDDASATATTELPTIESDREAQEIETPNVEAPDDNQGAEEGGDAADDQWVEGTMDALQYDADQLCDVNVALLARQPDAIQLLHRLGDTLTVLNRFRDALQQAIANEAAANCDAHDPEEPHHG